MFNQVLNLTAGIIGIAASIGGFGWLIHYAYQDPVNNNKDLKKMEAEDDENN